MEEKTRKEKSRGKDRMEEPSVEEKQNSTMENIKHSKKEEIVGKKEKRRKVEGKRKWEESRTGGRSQAQPNEGKDKMAKY